MGMPITLPAGVFAPEAITRSELDFSQEDTGETIDLTPQAKRARTMQALSDELMALAERQAVLLVLYEVYRKVMEPPPVSPPKD